MINPKPIKGPITTLTTPKIDACVQETTFNLDKATLAAQAKQHHYRADVSLYQNENNATVKAAFAEMLLSDKAYSRYIFEANLDWKTLYKDKRQFEHQKHLQACTKADRGNYQLIAKYQQARIDTAVAFGEVNRIPSHEKSLEKFARINALALLNTSSVIVCSTCRRVFISIK